MHSNSITDLRIGRSTAPIGLLVAALLTAPDALAVPFNSNVSISASVTLNGLSTSAPPGLTQSGIFSATVGGSTSSVNADAPPAPSSLPLGGALTDINDGVGMNFTGSGNSANGTGRSDLFGDYSVVLSNQSATDTFIVTLGWQFTNQIDANGADAYAKGEMFLNNGAPQDLVFSDLISDTVLGDQAGGSNDGTQWDTPFGFLTSFGAALLDSGTVLLDFTLSPGQTINLTGRNDMSGIVNSGDYSATVDSRVFVSGVVNQTTTTPPPPALPEPASLWLFGAGLMGLRAVRRSRAGH